VAVGHSTRGKPAGLLTTSLYIGQAALGRAHPGEHQGIVDPPPVTNGCRRLLQYTREPTGRLGAGSRRCDGLVAYVFVHCTCPTLLRERNTRYRYYAACTPKAGLSGLSVAVLARRTERNGS